MYRFYLFAFLICTLSIIQARDVNDPALLTIDKIFASDTLRQGYMPSFQWIDNGEACAWTAYNEKGGQALTKAKYISEGGVDQAGLKS